MKVVFVQDVPNVALEGDVKEVKKGHARNYLFPKGFAVLATSEELKRVESRQRAATKRREEQAAEALGVAGTMAGISLVFAKKVTSKGNIYGSVSNTAIQQELKRLGHSVEKSMIKLEDPLRQLGEHEVEIELSKDAIATIKVTIEAAEGEKAEEKAEAAAVEEPTVETIEDAVEEAPTETTVETAVVEEPLETTAEITEETAAEEPDEAKTDDE